MAFDQARLSALLNLLDEPDDVVWFDIKDKIVEMGEEALPELKIAFENSFAPLLQNRLKDIIATLNFLKSSREIKTWSVLGQGSLLTGTMIIERAFNPHFDEEVYRKQLETIRFDIWLELNQSLSPLEKIKVFNQVLFHVYGFNRYIGNSPDTLPPLLSSALEHRAGSEFASSLLYLLLGLENNLPLNAFLFGKKLFLAYTNTDEEDSLEFLGQNEPLFFIDPPSLGLVLSRQDITDAFSSLSDFNKELSRHLISNKKVIQLQLLYLHSFYSINKDGEKSELAYKLMQELKRNI